MALTTCQSLSEQRERDKAHVQALLVEPMPQNAHIRGAKKSAAAIIGLTEDVAYKKQ